MGPHEGRRDFDRCTSDHSRGQTVCANGREAPMVEADDAVLSPIIGYVLQPEVRSARHRVRLTAAIGQGGELQSLVDALKARHTKRDTAAAQIASPDWPEVKRVLVRCAEPRRALIDAGRGRVESRSSSEWGGTAPR